MKNRAIDNTKVGAFVLAGLVFLILMLYMIGKNRNLLGSTFTITAVVHNVNGLVPGNNVRFKGMDVGTVKSIVVSNDSLIDIILTIDEEMKPYIKKNSIASIGTDGLMGNKLVNINSASDHSPSVEEGDVIQGRRSIETDEMLRTLNTTNNNIEKISSNLYEISTKLNSSESLWTLLSDSIISRDLKMAVADLRVAGRNTAELTGTARDLAKRLERGNGIAYTLFNDTTLANQLTTSLNDIQQASTEASEIVGELKTVVNDMKSGEGTAGLILTDTLLRQSLFKSATNIEQGTARFNQNMEALKTNFLFKKYYKKLEKEEQKAAKASKE